jgi:hypothetical protein
MEVEKTVTRKYVFTQQELQARLGIEGDIKQMGLESGLPPAAEEKGASRKNCTFFIETELKKKAPIVKKRP